MDRLKELLKDEPNTCSIELSASDAGTNGSIVIDQSLDLTIRGDPKMVLKAVRFLFPEKEVMGASVLNVNRGFIKRMRMAGNTMRGTDRRAGVAATFAWNNDPKDIGHLLNAVRLNGGTMYVEKGMKGKEALKL